MAFRQIIYTLIMQNTVSEYSRPGVDQLTIAIFVPWITQTRGGTEVIGSLIASGMAERGHKVCLYTFDDNHGVSLLQLDPRIKLRTLAEDNLPQSVTQMLLELQVDRPDVILGLHMNRAFLRYIYVAWRLDIPVILSEHINPEYPRKFKTFKETERAVMFSGANKIHLLIEDFRESLPDYLQDRIEVINNSARAPRKLAEPGKHSNNYILTVARLVPTKRIDLLVSTFAEIVRSYPRWELLIAGYGGMQDDLQKLAKNLGISDSVKFLGQVEDTYHLYQNASLFALPSETEGFPMTVLEAMAHALPVIGFEDCKGLNQQVIHRETGILAGARDREKGLVDALKQLVDSSDLREEMGRRGHQRFLNEYSQEKILGQWEELIINTAADRGNLLRKSGLSALSIANARLISAMQSGLDNYDPMSLGD